MDVLRFVLCMLPCYNEPGLQVDSAGLQVPVQVQVLAASKIFNPIQIDDDVANIYISSLNSIKHY